MKTVVIYVREGCCLCEQAVELLERVRADHPFNLEQRDIEASEDLFRAYLERIPVVTVDGVEAFELFVDEAQLKHVLDAPTSEPVGDGPPPPSPEPVGDGPLPRSPERVTDGPLPPSPEPVEDGR